MGPQGLLDDLGARAVLDLARSFYHVEQLLGERDCDLLDSHGMNLSRRGEIGIGSRPVTHIRAREGYVDRDHVTADDPARFPFADGLCQIREGGESCVFFAGG